MRKYNYHTHSKWCKHASGTLEELVIEAIDKELDVLGLSPHIPIPKDLYWRMKVDEFNDFYTEYSRVKNKYSHLIDLRLGLEAEYFPHHFDFYDALKEKYEIDYFILGHHFKQNETYYYGELTTKEDLIEYVETMKDAIKTGRYQFVAHPDVFSISYPEDDEMIEWAANEIFSTCEAFDLPVEFNANGIRRGKVSKDFGEHYAYPWDSFWKHASKYKLKVLINSDNHSTEALWDECVLEAYHKALRLGLNIVDDYK